MDRVEFDRILEGHYRKYFHPLSKQLGARLQSSAKAEDAIQTAYVRALTYYKTLPNAESFHPWYMIILQNAVKDQNKADTLHGMTDEELEELSPTINNAGLPSIILAEILQYIDKAPKREQEVLKLFLFHQYNPKEISQLTKEKAGTIRVMVHKFRKEIRDELKVDL